MKVYISSDIEGCVGVTTWCETENGQEVLHGIYIHKMLSMQSMMG